MLKKVFETAGVAVSELPEGVMVNWRDGFWVACNYSSSNVIINIPASAKIIFGAKELTPAGVAVWKE